MNDIAETIKRGIRNDGRTLYALSKASGVNASVLSRFSRGERDISLESASKMLAALGLEIVPTTQRAAARNLSRKG